MKQLLLAYLEDLDSRYYSEEIARSPSYQQEAAKVIAKYESLEPEIANHPFLLNNMGLFYLRSGLFEEAVVMLERAFHSDPSNKHYLSSLAFAYYKNGQIDLALQCVKSADLFDLSEQSLSKEFTDYSASVESSKKAVFGFGINQRRRILR